MQGNDGEEEWTRERELEEEREGERKELNEGNKSLTSSADCDTLTPLSFVNQ